MKVNKKFDCQTVTGNENGDYLEVFSCGNKQGFETKCTVNGKTKKGVILLSNTQMLDLAKSIISSETQLQGTKKLKLKLVIKELTGKANELIDENVEVNKRLGAALLEIDAMQDLEDLRRIKVDEILVRNTALNHDNNSLRTANEIKTKKLVCYMLEASNLRKEIADLKEDIEGYATINPS